MPESCSSSLPLGLPPSCGCVEDRPGEPPADRSAGELGLERSAGELAAEGDREAERRAGGGGQPLARLLGAHLRVYVHVITTSAPSGRPWAPLLGSHAAHTPARLPCAHRGTAEAGSTQSTHHKPHTGSPCMPAPCAPRCRVPQCSASSQHSPPGSSPAALSTRIHIPTAQCTQSHTHGRAWFST